MENARRGSILEFKHAHLMYKNFTGVVKEGNPNGRRQFAIIISEEDYIRLKEEGWNVGYREPFNGYPDGAYYLNVEARFSPYPPHIYEHVGTPDAKPIELDEDNVYVLDKLHISDCYAVIAPRTWDRGIKAYLRSMDVVVDEMNDYSMDGYYAR